MPSLSLQISSLECFNSKYNLFHSKMLNCAFWPSVNILGISIFFVGIHIMFFVCSNFPSFIIVPTIIYDILMFLCCRSLFIFPFLCLYYIMVRQSLMSGNLSLLLLLLLLLISCPSVRVEYEITFFCPFPCALSTWSSHYFLSLLTDLIPFDFISCTILGNLYSLHLLYVAGSLTPLCTSSYNYQVLLFSSFIFKAISSCSPKCTS